MMAVGHHSTTEGQPPALRVAGLSKRFGPTVALEGVDVSVRAGEVHAVIGENGAGKSTLMNILAGSIRPDRGDMSVMDRAYDPGSPLDARRHGIALIHQELALCPHLTVAENVMLGAEPSRFGLFDRDAARDRSARLLSHFEHHAVHPDARVGDLSLAARQVVEICRALAADARILLMDEPTSSFQRADTDRLFALIRRLAGQGIAIMYISHLLEEVREIADRYTVLRDGRTVDAGAIQDVTNDQVIEAMVGRPMTGLFPHRAPSAAGDMVLEVDSLAALPAVTHASFELRAGEILGIAGLMGSGRTELVRALFALDQPTGGRVMLRGRPVAIGSSASSARRVDEGFGYLSEDRKGEGLALPLSIADNLTATRLSACTRSWGSGKGSGILDLGLQREHASRWIRDLRIRARSPDQRVAALSGGNQQKVALGRLLFQDADVLLLDEPTRGIDIGSKAQVYEAIAGAAASGKAVLMVSSYLPELFGLCDRIAVMSRGRLSPARPVAEWTPQSVMAASIGSLSV